MGSHTELIFVEGHSRDDTLDQCRAVAATMPDKDIKVFTQKGRGKGDAVRLGFSEASGDILMILDADLSVAPEDLPQFYNALVGGKGEFINGSRLVYAKDPKAMRFLNLLGNKFFALLLTRLLANRLKTPFAAPRCYIETTMIGLRETVTILATLIPSVTLTYCSVLLNKT